MVAGRPAQVWVAVDRLDGLRFHETGVGLAQELGAARVRQRPQAFAAYATGVKQNKIASSFPSARMINEATDALVQSISQSSRSWRRAKGVIMRT